MMQIEFRNVVPFPLADTPPADGSCWGTELVIGSENFCLAEAPSGTGKTTLLSILYGTRFDYSGDVFFDGKPVRDFSLAHWTKIRREIFSIVFQELRLFPQLTAMQNIRIKNELTAALSDEDIRGMAEQLGIAQHLDRPVAKMSLGQQQRVAIIRALAQPFRFLLLDEPFSHLDDTNAKKACAMITAACKKNNAGLLLTSLGNDHHFTFDKTILL